MERYHAKVIHSDWLGHVRTKQKAIEACSHDWVLCIDSDESIEPALAASIRAAFASPSADGYEVNRKVYYRDRPLNHAWQPEWRVRLVNRHRFHWTGLDPHDSLQPLPPPADPTRPAARIQRLTGVMRHDSIGAFADFFVKQASHARTMARSLHASGKRGSILKLVSSPIGAMLKQVVVKQAWRDGYPGWLAASATAAGTLIKHAVLIELSNTPDDPR